METNEPFHRVVILCDSMDDHTAGSQQFIFLRFAASGLAYVEQWEKGLISTREQIDQTSHDGCRAGRDCFGVERDPIDPTFYDLVTFVDQNDWGWPWS